MHAGNLMLTDYDKQVTGNREPANEMNKEDPTQDIPVWLQPFTVNLEDLERCARTFLCKREDSDSEGDASKVETQKRKHSVQGATELGPGRLRPAFVTELGPTELGPSELGPSELGPTELGPVLSFKG